MIKKIKEYFSNQTLKEVFESFGSTTSGLIIGCGGVFIGVLLIESNPIASLFNTIVGSSMVTMTYIKVYTESLKKQLDSIEEKINHKTML